MAIRRTRKTSEDENLTEDAFKKVIEGLNAEKPITKKEACAILQITYNTTRLDRLITEYQEKKEHEAKRRSEKRGKPATMDEVALVVSEYMEGKPIDGIAKTLYRGITFVKSIIETYGVPERATSPDYFHPKLIPDAAVRDRFSIGEKVYSARYDSLATIRAEQQTKDGFVYRIWLDGEEWQQFAYQPHWELASLQHLTEKGINL